MSAVTPIQVEFLKLEDGAKPCAVWIRSLTDLKARAAVVARISRLEQGNLGSCRSLGEGLGELKIDVGPGYRVYYGLQGATLVIILTGGDKGSQARDITEARRLWREWKKASNKP